jgi:hypothetical protein
VILALLGAFLVVPRPAAALAEPEPNQVILFKGGGLSGPSKSWSLPPDQPFLAVPYLGEDLSGESGSIAIGADVAVILLSEPFFSATDETCEYSLGTGQRPDFWWLSQKTRVAPGPDDVGAIDAGLGGQPVASLIIFQRALGPPPAVQLLEKRRGVNWNCAKPTKARSYRRLFIPVAAAPHAVGCFNLAVELSYGETAEVELDFSAASSLLIMLPRDVGDRYRTVEHEITVGLYDAADCTGEGVAFAYPASEDRHFELKQFGFDRKARSVLIRYDKGAFDSYLPPPDQRPAVAVQEIAKALAEASAAAPAGEIETVPAAVDPVAAAALPETAAAQAEETAGASTESAAAATTWGTSEAEASAVGTLAKAYVASQGTTSETTAPEGAAPETAAPEDAAPEGAVLETTVLETTVLEGADLEGAAPEATAPEDAALEGAVLETTVLETTVLEGAAPETTAPETTVLETTVLETTVLETTVLETTVLEGAALEGAAPAQMEIPPSGAFDEGAEGAELQTGALVLPESLAPPTGEIQTFRYPLLQGYRLNHCLIGQKDCGGPVATEWCKSLGFARAITWEIDENIGSLFPTLAIGDLQLCPNFVCDGFKEITCE